MMCQTIDAVHALELMFWTQMTTFVKILALLNKYWTRMDADHALITKPIVPLVVNQDLL
jgi:hypothetical protein